MLEQIVSILKDYKDDQGLVITEGTTFGDLTLDSLDIVELIIRMEEQFSVSIEASEDMKTVGDLLKCIQGAQ